MSLARHRIVKRNGRVCIEATEEAPTICIPPPGPVSAATRAKLMRSLWEPRSNAGLPYVAFAFLTFLALLALAGIGGAC